MISLTWTGIEVRAGKPPEIAERLVAAINDTPADEELQAGVSTEIPSALRVHHDG